MTFLSRMVGRWRRPHAGADGEHPDDAQAAPNFASVRESLERGELPGAIHKLASVPGAATGEGTRLILRARVLERWGRIREAKRALFESAAHDPIDGLEADDRAFVLLRHGKLAEAIVALRDSVASEPDKSVLRAELARALEAAGQNDAALDEWRRLVASADATPGSFIGCASLEHRLGKALASQATIDRSIHVHPNEDSLHATRGALLHAAGRFEEALESYARMSAHGNGGVTPSPYFIEHAIALCECSRNRDGAELLLSRLPHAPYVRGHQQLATAASTLGWLQIGWPQLEYRWMEGPVAAVRPSHALPPWRGQDLRGKTILVRAEQGIGDTLQYARYLRVLRERGARVLFLPLEGMLTFARRIDGQDRIVDMSFDVRGVDWYIDLMSIPGLVGTTVANIPPPTVLAPAATPVRERWAARMAGRTSLRVGLVWAGRPEHPRDRERSLSFGQLRPLFDVPGIEWVSLQKGPAAGGAVGELRPQCFVDLQENLVTLDDTAEAMGHCDLVISVDTAMAHLAATLGMPVWTLVPTPADGRWLEGRSDSPWYPTMRLFRQPQSGDWATPVARMANRLREVAVGDPVAEHETDAILPSSDEPSTLTSTALARVIDTRLGLLQFLPDGSDEALSLERLGEWNEDWLQVLLALAQPDGRYAMAGASFGEHAIPFARTLNEHGDLLAWEARPTRRLILSNNVRKHRLESITIMTRELGRTARDAFGPGRESIDDLGLPRLDGLIVAHGSDCTAVLEGASNALWQFRPWVSVGLGHRSEVESPVTLLRTFGHRIFSMEAPLFQKDNFYRRSSDPFEGRRGISLLSWPEERPLPAVPAACVELSD